MLISGPVGYRLPEQDGHAAGYITAEDLKKASLGVQEAVMRVWFHEHYDPPDELPYDGREGGYQFIFGGPYDPEEELESEFGQIVPESVINDLARKLWNLHSEWSGLDPGPDPDDDYVQHLYGSIKESLGPFEEFTRSLTDIRGLRRLEVEQSRQQCLNRLLYANVITSLEAYLSDFFQTAVEKYPKLRRRFVETTPEFSKQRFSLSEVFEEHERIEAKVGEYLVAVLWHNLAVVRNMFADTLGIKFPDEMVRLFKAVLVRHDLVHRNGRKKEGGEHSITLNEVDELLGMTESLVNDIEKQWKTLDPANEF